MKKPWGFMQYQECECHPLPSIGPFKRYKLDYLREVHLPSVGLIKIDLARPYKGTSQFGVLVKAFGSLWICIFGWTHARR
jgi:hypothetical protein